jgi:hypothetical protein
VRIRTPVMDLEGLITPTHLHYTVQHFAVPPVVETDAWDSMVVGEVKAPLTLNFDRLRRFPGRSVRTVMKCSGSDATFFEYFKGEGWFSRQGDRRSSTLWRKERSYPSPAMAVRGIVLGSLPSVGSRLGLLDDEAHTLLIDRFSWPCKLPCTASRKVRLPRIGERCDAADPGGAGPCCE